MKQWKCSMTKYLISFPASAMKHIPYENLPAVSAASRVVVQKAKDAGVWVFGGAINENVPSLMVSGDGTVTNDTYPQTREFNGGFAILEVPSKEEALVWAAKFAVSCRCAQELREFHYDPES
jgi:hypothetical protein